MKEFYRHYWSMTWGALSSMSFKGISEITDSPEMVNLAQNTFNDNPPLLKYFLVGVVGALGGLMVKIAWCFIKRIFPKLNSFDK